MASKKRQILIVDDDSGIVKLLSDYLKAKGYEVITSENGWDCLWQLTTKKPDGIILDLGMPKLDGFKTLDLMRLTKLTQGIPVIIATASGDKNSVIKIARLGADDYIVKPYSFEGLVNRLENLIFTVDQPILRDILNSMIDNKTPLHNWPVVLHTKYRAWGAFSCSYQSREICVLLANGLIPLKALNLSDNELSQKAVVFAHFKRNWKCVWPLNADDIPSAVTNCAF